MDIPHPLALFANHVTQTFLFGYVPTSWICIVLLVFFGISTLGHLCQAIYFRLWWLIPTAVAAGILELIGWGAREWASKIPSEPNFNPYLIQIVATIIAPTPLVAANFIILGRIIQRLGSKYSRLSAMWYSVVFVSCDAVALIVQAVGGSIASKAVRQSEDPEKGGHIMLGGIVFQMAAIIAYATLASEFLVRYLQDRPLSMYSRDRSSPDRAPLSMRMRLMLTGMAMMTVFILIRSIYRTIELINGFQGTIIQTQVLFNVLDGTMIVLAMWTLNIFHPGLLLVSEVTEKAGRDSVLLDSMETKPLEAQP
ncbi:RTA1-domain-containing protein [Peniophora sp. CONT]|nr:RTA1-domain-containing protein [Peniophora sp. CONT]